MKRQRNTNPYQLCLLLGAAAALTVCTAAGAATISTAGTVLNQPAWHSTGTAKTLDANGDNRYGTDGYVIFGVTDQEANAGDGYQSVANVPPSDFGDTFVASNDGGVTVHEGTESDEGGFRPGLPTYLPSSGFTDGADYLSAAANYGYAEGDDPRLQTSATVADTQIGTIAGPQNSTVGAFQHLFSFTVDATAPDNFRIGILYGNVNDFLTPTAIRVDENGGSGTATISGLTVPTSPQLNWAFFDITGAADGDTFDIFGQVRDRSGSTNDRVGLGGITFDTTVIPTPAALPAGLALMGLTMMRRRRA